MKDQLQIIHEAVNELHDSFPEKERALTALAQLEAMVGEPAAYLYASIAGPVELHRLQQIGHAKPLYFQDQLENDLRAQTEYPDAHSCVPLYAVPVAQQPQAEAVLPTHVLVPVEPDETWAYRVIRHHQPNLDVGCKAWLDCLEELLHWHEAIAAAKKEAGHE